MRQILDATTLTAEQRKYLLMTFASTDLFLSIINELNPEWMPVLQIKTNEFLDKILAYPEEKQLEKLQEYLCVDDD